jgi:ACS family tartrate transporter-like MFS transporter
VTQADAQNDAIRKVMWRLLPMAMLLFFFSLLDRTNISFAALDMNKDLALSPAQYGTAASIFFIGYFFFEIPSNLLLERVGARIWLARIMITWGAVVGAMAYVEGTLSLYILRFLLGVAEAGLLPGLLLYLGYWLPARQRGVAYAILLMTTALAYAIGAPFTTLLMQVSVFGFRGWQTMFLIQGLLTILIGIATLFILPSKVRDAKWLSNDEKDALSACIDEEMAMKSAVGATRRRDGFLDTRVLISTVMSFFLVCANFGTVLWLPQIVKGTFPALTNIQISLLISLAFIIGGIAGLLAGRNSDRTGDRKWHLVTSALIGTIGYAFAAAAPTPLLSFVGICIGVFGIWSMFGVYWAYNGDLLGGPAAAGGLALINSVGSIGGIVAPLVLGWALQQTGNFSGSLAALSVFSLLTMISAMCLKVLRRIAPEIAVGIAQ